MKSKYVMKLALTGMLIAIGLIIPMFSPAKIIIEPASFTLASHVAIFVAMFISPAVAVSVAAGTALGFLFGGFPIIVVLRAATHIVFALVGSFYLHKVSIKPLTAISLRVFSFCIALIHAACELIIVSIFYFDGSISPAYIKQGFTTSVLLLVGLGTVIHSMIDLEIANVIMLPMRKIIPEYIIKS